MNMMKKITQSTLVGQMKVNSRISIEVPRPLPEKKYPD